MKLLDFLFDTLFPEKFTCDLCGKEIFTGKNFCDACDETIHKNNGLACPKCGRRTIADELCPECKEYAPLYDKAYSAFVYDDGVQKLINRFKTGKSYLYKFFARSMFEKTGKIDGIDGVCYVPMTHSSKAVRGYNQAALLAKAYSKLAGLPLIKHPVDKIRDTSMQKSLTKNERAENLKGCFRAYSDVVKGKKLIVIDDVMTTGATADAVTKELKRCGAKGVIFVTAASVEFKVKLT